MKAVVNKICKWCGEAAPKHWPYQCRENPNKNKAIHRIIRTRGKEAENWAMIRKSWFVAHPQDSYECYSCGKTLLPVATTLDHVIPRSNAKNYANRHEFDNLKPCCWSCNYEKGSKHR